MPRKTNPIAELIDCSPCTAEQFAALITDLTEALTAEGADVYVSQKDLADALGTSQSRISSYATGRDPVPPRFGGVMRLLVEKAQAARTKKRPAKAA